MYLFSLDFDMVVIAGTHCFVYCVYSSKAWPAEFNYVESGNYIFAKYTAATLV